MRLAATKDLAIAANDNVSHKAVALVPQFSRYSVASVVALATDFTVYGALCALAVNAPVAGIIGYTIGMIVHYALSSTFVFDVAHAQKPAARRALEFAASGLLGLILTGLVITVLTNHFAASPVAAKIAAVAVSFLAVFMVRRSIVFAAISGKNISDAGLVYSKAGSCD
ncbi:GtrA family protein [Hyphomicrobium sp.]|jgi:putative flippase GtrA|uniref:GtrA family protein n=1 Tax=Hyphomicrobium sp. TaxID=82 RepID=UPI0035644129